jgi:hypothetical protein
VGAHDGTILRRDKIRVVAHTPTRISLPAPGCSGPRAISRRWHTRVSHSQLLLRSTGGSPDEIGIRIDVLLKPLQSA